MIELYYVHVVYRHFGTALRSACSQKGIASVAVTIIVGIVAAALAELLI